MEVLTAIYVAIVNFYIRSIRCIFLNSMHQAIEAGDEDAIEQWLKNEKGNVNKCRGGNAIHRHFAVGNGTALHWAVYYGRQDIAQLLLDTGAGITRIKAVV